MAALLFLMFLQLACSACFEVLLASSRRALPSITLTLTLTLTLSGYYVSLASHHWLLLLLTWLL